MTEVDGGLIFMQGDFVDLQEVNCDEWGPLD